MKIQRVAVLAVLPVVAGTMAIATAGPASAATNPHASCVAQITTDPMFGPSGQAPGGPVGGRIASTVAHAHADCVDVLFSVFNPFA